ncbi:MAG: dihydrolipoamide dehydrogenase [Dehalococcoidia bacterium SM23_28_2]|nr:MAG: dihydrolipoamide dehydrogenase [Dehalococcoidia bacterium SM23_28_2]
MQSFDLIVIGSGSGLTVSSEAADLGLAVAVVEHGPFGGTCLNRGCIPSKMLIHSADVMETIRRADLFGISAQVSGVDWDFIVRRVANTIDADAQAIEEANRQHPNITVFKDTGRFVGRKALEVGGKRITAETIVIAAGTRPRVPDIDGLTDVPFVTSDEALRLPKQPRRLAIVGGGYIAAELAHFFGALGTEVTIVHRRPRLLRLEDDDVSALFTEVYQRRFTMLLNTVVRRAYRDGETIALELASDGQQRTLTTDALLLAVGRVPNTDLLDVAQTGVAVNDRGFIKVDEYLETDVPGIWALGDIVGRYLLKHSADLEAAHVAQNILNSENKMPVDYHAMPHAIFSSPQVASVGLTERQAQEQGLPYVAGTYKYYDTAYGFSIEDKDGFAKVIAQRETGEILGCHIIGSEASILIQEVANAVRMRLTTEAISQAIYVHPALPEVVQRAFHSLPI